MKLLSDFVSGWKMLSMSMHRLTIIQKYEE